VAGRAGHFSGKVEQPRRPPARPKGNEIHRGFGIFLLLFNELRGD